MCVSAENVAVLVAQSTVFVEQTYTRMFPYALQV